MWFNLITSVYYVGDTNNIIIRIRTDHCSGNVEGSAFRKLVAETLNLEIVKTRRASGTTRV